MKRNLIIAITFFSFTAVFSQTREKEGQYLDMLYRSGGLSLEEYRERGKQWAELISKIGEYPDLPYDDETGSIVFKYIKSYPFQKQIIFNRIKEWAALSFGSLSSVLHYENIESGKIILKGYFNIPYIEDVQYWFSERENINAAKCSHTYLFTIKDNKVKVDIINLEYEFIYVALGGGTPLTKTRDLDSLYPVTKDNSLQWRSKLSILENTEIRINGLIMSLDRYINAFGVDYSF